MNHAIKRTQKQSQIPIYRINKVSIKLKKQRKIRPHLIKRMKSKLNSSKFLLPICSISPHVSKHSQPLIQCIPNNRSLKRRLKQHHNRLTTIILTNTRVRGLIILRTQTLKCQHVIIEGQEEPLASLECSHLMTKSELVTS